jgi:nicotinate-nucleotide adenylyltransferase
VDVSTHSNVIAIYGGSFNPPHVGHAMVAQWVLWTGQATEVWLVPVFRHAFEGRHDKVLAPFDVRVDWCRSMARDLGAAVKVSDVESTLPPPSFTIHTLEHLARQHPDCQFRLIIGADSLPHLPAWHRWSDIEAHFSPIIAGRQGHPAPEGRPTIDFPNVSSTDVRQRIQAGSPVEHLLPKGVAKALADWNFG